MKKTIKKRLRKIAIRKKEAPPKERKIYPVYDFGDDGYNPIIGRLNTLKRGLQITDAELSERSGVQPSTIDRLLGGRTKDPRHSTVARLCISMDQPDFAMTEYKYGETQKKKR